MSESNHEIRIDDLAEPVLTPIQQGARDALAGVTIDISSESILTEAVDQTGLSHFGEESFRERLEVQVESVNEDANLGPAGRMGVRRDLVRYASNRLRFEDLLVRHPEILDVEIREPIIIIGLPCPDREPPIC